MLQDGSTLGQRLGDAGSAVVLVMDPGDCFRCLGVLAEWLEWHRTGGRFRLLFSRQPTDLERRLLIVAGLRPEPFMATGTPPPEHAPMELVVQEGRLVCADSAGARRHEPAHCAATPPPPPAHPPTASTASRRPFDCPLLASAISPSCDLNRLWTTGGLRPA